MSRLYERAEAITAADEDLSETCTGLLVAAEGSVVVRLVGDGTTDTSLGTLPAGTLLRGLAVKRVAAASTATVVALRGRSRA